MVGGRVSGDKTFHSDVSTGSKTYVTKGILSLCPGVLLETISCIFLICHFVVLFLLPYAALVYINFADQIKSLGLY